MALLSLVVLLVSVPAVAVWRSDLQGVCQMPRGHSLLQTTAVRSRNGSIIYGVMTTGTPEYRARLQTQLETWASGLPEQKRFFAVAGSGAGGFRAEDGFIVEDRCPDSREGVTCKERRILEEGRRRGAAWLVVLGEDNYVNTELMEKALSEREADSHSDKPVILGIVGCGTGLGYCPEVDERGGLCGGGGYAVNRAALKAITSQSQEQLRSEYLPNMTFGDIATSCAALKQGVELLPLEGLRGWYDKPTELRHLIHGNTLTYHYVFPATMRWLDAHLHHRPEPEVKRLQALAMEVEDVHPMQAMQLEASPSPQSWASLAAAYVKLRDAQLRVKRV